MLAAPAVGQEAQSQARHEFNIPAQPAASALQDFARQSGKQVLFPYDAVADRVVPAIRGNLSDQEVLNRLATAAGLSVVSDDGRTVTLRADPNVRIEEIVVTARGLSAMRVPMALREIPQSVSVIQRETLDQQNANDLADAMNYATGITVLQSDSLSSGFYSRGFSIGQIHVDGSAPLVLDGNSNVMVPDMAQYEQVEVLRGADGLFGGFGNPGGTINLQRKMPQRQAQGQVELLAGSWNNFRAVADVTGPISADGDLRARAVLVYEDRDYFYDHGSLARGKLYGVLAYSIGPSTEVRVGGAYEESDAVPVLYGVLPYSDGSDARLPRSTALVPPWNRTDLGSTELFAQFDHHFGSDWVLKANITRLRQTNDSKYAYVLGSINPVTDEVNGPSATRTDSVSRNLLVDATLTGAFHLFGQRHEIIVGMDHAYLSSQMGLDFYNIYVPPFNPFTSNLNDMPEPDEVMMGTASEFRRSQLGMMGAVRMNFTDDLSVTGGLRNSYLTQRQNNQTYLFGDLLFEQELSSRTRGKVVPYGGIVYDISPVYSVYASYADIFRPATGLLRSDMTRLPSSMDGVNIEAGIKSAWRRGTLNGSLSFFKIDQTGGSVRDPSVNSPIPDCCYLPQTSRSRGFELELSGRLTPQWTISTGYTYNDNKVTSEAVADHVPLSSQTPRHLFKLWSNYDLTGELQGWSFGGGIVAQSSSYVAGEGCPAYDNLGNCQPGVNPNTPFRMTQDAYAVVDLRIAHEINANWAAAFSFNNIFDQHYYRNIGQNSSGLIDSWYGEPRNVLLKLTGKY